jgi:hypothetical protein
LNTCYLFFLQGKSVGEYFDGFVTGSLSGLVCGCGNMYSDDSDVATAAVHNGICSVGERKKVRIQLLGPVDGLSSSRANGISTRACAYWPGSFSFVNSDGASPQAAAAKMLALTSCDVSYDKPESALIVQSPSKLSVSVSLSVIDKLMYVAMPTASETF